jgi:hypothetical protein
LVVCVINILEDVEVGVIDALKVSEATSRCCRRFAESVDLLLDQSYLKEKHFRLFSVWY